MADHPQRSLAGLFSHINPLQMYPVDYAACDRYRYMIDGRTIYQYLLFIEPHLRAEASTASPSAHIYKVEDRLGSFPLYCPRVTLEGNHLFRFGLLFPVHADAAMSAQTLDTLTAAFRLITDIHLGFFADLGLSCILTSETLYNTPGALLLDDRITDPLIYVDRIIKTSASVLFLNWARVEARITNVSLTEVDRRVLQSLAEDFSVCVSSEGFRRLYNEANSPGLCLTNRDIPKEDALLERIYGLKALPLTAELFAYWYPLWNRWRLIFASPFDTMSSL